MLRKVSAGMFAALFLLLTASVSQASRIYITGAYLPAQDSALSPAGRYIQVYLNLLTDKKGTPVTGSQTSIAAQYTHLWGAVRQVDLSKYNVKAATGTITIVSDVKYNGLPATGTVLLSRASKNAKWQVSCTVVFNTEEGETVTLTNSSSSFLNGIWLVK